MGAVMDEELRQRATAALQGKLTRPCPYCGGEAWMMGEIVDLLPSRQDGSIIIGGPKIPVLLVVCRTCMGIAHFSAVGLGLDKPSGGD